MNILQADIMCDRDSKTNTHEHITGRYYIIYQGIETAKHIHMNVLQTNIVYLS